jgi:hypothetical protein
VLLCNETKCASDRGFTNSIQTTRTFSLETSGGYRRCLPKGSEFRPVVRGGGKLANGSQPTHASGHTASTSCPPRKSEQQRISADLPSRHAKNARIYVISNQVGLERADYSACTRRFWRLLSERPLRSTTFIG